MRGLDDGPDGLDDEAFDRALRGPRRRLTGANLARAVLTGLDLTRADTETAIATTPVGMPPEIAALVAAARAISPGVIIYTTISVLDGTVSVSLTTHTAQDARGLAKQLGMPEAAIGWASNGRSKWLSAELGEHGDPFVLSVIGGHSPVCQCHPSGEAP